MEQSPTAIPDVVKEFIQYFHKCYLEDNVYELHGCYENTFNKLTEKYYKNATILLFYVLLPQEHHVGAERRHTIIEAD